jgi:cellobiose-specific phosphotransferase system component IIC
MSIFRKIVTPFVAVFLGLATPVLIGLFLAALFKLPTFPVMLIIFAATIFLFWDLVKSYDKKL